MSGLGRLGDLVWCGVTLLAMGVSGCATGTDKADPWEGSNRDIDGFNNFVDRAVVKDISDAYTKHVPRPVRSGVNNFLNNLGYLNVILNDHLQGNFAQGWRNTERMAVNSTVGLLGVIDVATDLGRPKQSNDFGVTLGKWGVEAGPYVVLPVLGPTTTRDIPGIVVSRVTNPMFWIEAPLLVTIPMDTTSFVDQRANLQPQLDLRDRAAIDSYTFTRDAYLQHREAKITGKAIPPAVEDIYDEDGEGEPTSAPTAATQPVMLSAPAGD